MAGTMGDGRGTKEPDTAMDFVAGGAEKVRAADGGE